MYDGFVIGFSVSLIIVALILYTSNYHAHLSHDSDLSSVQKYHKEPVPRIGGLGIFLGIIAVVFSTIGTPVLIQHAVINYQDGLIVAAIIVFFAGLSEDIIKKISPRVRTILMLASIIIAIYFTHVLPVITYAGFDWLNRWLQIYYILGFCLTVFCVTGLTNAYNIIDGYNGLCATVAILNLLGLVFLASYVGESRVFFSSIILIAAILGFLIFNYPKGRIFLGDGGAYLIGFIIAVLSIYLTQVQHMYISPYAVLLLAIYPITEIGFSIYRKKCLRSSLASQPDGLHFHMLIYKRCISFDFKNRNAKVVIIMLFFTIPQTILAIVFYKNNLICLGLIIIYIIFYLISYFRIVRFKTFNFLKLML